MKVHPSHICTETKDLSNDINQFIMNNLEIGSSIEQIVNLVRVQFNFTISEDQVKVKKKDYVDNMISIFETCSKSNIAKLSAAEQLIKLFEGMTEVCLYMSNTILNLGL